MDNKTQERIKADAEAAAKIVEQRLKSRNIEYGRMVSQVHGYTAGYIAGATAEQQRAQGELKEAQDAARMFCNKHNETATQLAEVVDRAQVLVDALQHIIDNTEHEDYGSTHESCAVCIAEHALRKWKGKELQQANDKCRCIQPNWNAFTGKCLTCGKP